MKLQRIAIAVTVLNLALTVFLLSQFRRAQAEQVTPVLRGRALEIARHGKFVKVTDKKGREQTLDLLASNQVTLNVERAVKDSEDIDLLIRLDQISNP